MSFLSGVQKYGTYSKSGILGFFFKVFSFFKLVTTIISIMTVRVDTKHWIQWIIHWIQCLVSILNWLYLAGQWMVCFPTQQSSNVFFCGWSFNCGGLFNTVHTIYIFVITNHQPLFRYASPYLWNQLPSSFRQLHSVHTPPGSPHPVHITSSQS